MINIRCFKYFFREKKKY